MATPITQLGGNFKLGPNVGSAIDYSVRVMKMTLNLQRATYTIPGTLGLPFESEGAGVRKEQLTIDFFSSSDATDVLDELYTAYLLDDPVLYFEGTLNTGAVSVDNPKYSGNVRVMNLDLFPSEVGALRTQSQTYPLVGTHTKATS